MPRRTPRLLTIALSHYCERARWALDRAAIPYSEEAHLPLLSRIYTAGVGGRTVPVLVTAEAVVSGSDAIVEWAARRSPAAGLYPSDPADHRRVLQIEQYVERELGPHARRWAYSILLDHPALLRPCFSRGVPRAEQLLTPLVVKMVPSLIRRGYRVSEETGRASLARALRAFERVAGWLADGRRHLAGDHSTAADITFASLAAPLVFPPEYGGALPSLNALPWSMRVQVEQLRATRAGKFALAAYARDRGHAVQLKAVG